jgi:hypothetical protein
MKDVSLQDLAVIKEAAGEVINMNTYAIQELQQKIIEKSISDEDATKTRIEAQAKIAEADKLYKKANEAIIDRAVQIFNQNT